MSFLEFVDRIALHPEFSDCLQLNTSLSILTNSK